MSKQQVIIFVNGGKDFKVPESCEGIFYPLKFNSEEFLKWKHELNQGIREEFLRIEHREEASLYQELYNAIDKNFVSALDREYMTYTRFLVDPRDPVGVPDVLEETGNPEPGARVYRELSDSECRFGAEFEHYKELYGNFLTVLRHCAVKTPNLAPKYVVDALGISEFVEENNEFKITYDSISKSSWKEIYRWPVVKNFIENKKEQFPELAHLIDIYGEPVTANISANSVLFNEQYADILDKEDSSMIVKDLTEIYGTENVNCYDL